MLSETEAKDLWAGYYGLYNTASKALDQVLSDKKVDVFTKVNLAQQLAIAEVIFAEYEHQEKTHYWKDYLNEHKGKIT